MTSDSLIYFDLFNSLLCDSKATSIAFEHACTKAKKLVSSLNNTASTLNSFLDSIQEISDHANNLKGASRDIGADLTRFCLRQRSFENHIKSLASSLTEHFIGELEKKTQISKTKFGDIERKYGRLFKKSKNSHKKGFNDYIKLEQKNGCIDALMYQRNQFIMFVNSIIPAMSVQVDMIEEGRNFKEIRDSLERTLTNCNSHEIVAVTIDDLVNNSEKSWNNRISVTLRKSQQNLSDSISNSQHTVCRPPSPSASIATWNTESSDNSKYQSITNLRAISTNGTLILPHQHTLQRPTLTASTFISNSSNTNLGKPPLPGRQSMTSSFYGSPPNTQTSGFNSLSISSNDLCDNSTSIVRPISLYGGDSALSVDEGNTTIKCSSFLSDTISQIDQLSSVLNDYCETSTTLTRQISPLNINQPIKSTSVRLRDNWKPPPPERRNSSITSATKNAPSIAEVRLTSACQSRASSIQDLTTISSNTSGISPNQTPTATEYVQPPSLILQAHHYQQAPPSTFSFRI
ncbi:IRSp53/MIM homology domain (IMD)-containing protein [Strongyloides ratti]|uniref:IRSp53/MIM homology domain (IMD)-containing protein n=1 Tax=Strongyloides ratti TaxID=34506 RepID=A0A090L7B2_STRRB|nr:IRSp53/MIM homology domain (IMD)-containing protein [Strongyloides ratti]CEF65661.1 IRSp53/MIM homology domain (IMD)-containing protein [Strongyloides ratti]